MTQGECGKFLVEPIVVQPMSQVWYAACEEFEDDPGAKPREVGRFLNEHDALHYVNWRNTVGDGVYTCPDCGHREETDPGCSNCCRDGQQ